jgi:hypothetical protein
LTLACNRLHVCTNAALLLLPFAPITSDDMCWFVLHWRPGLACLAKTKERAEQKQLKGINAQRIISLALLPTFHHTISSPITSASPSQQPYTSHIHHVQSSPPTPAALHLKLLGPRGSDWAGVLTSGLRGFPSCTIRHKRFCAAEAMAGPTRNSIHSQANCIYVLARLDSSSQYMSPAKASCTNLLQHAGPS